MQGEVNDAHRLIQVLEQAADELVRLKPNANTSMVAIARSGPATAPTPATATAVAAGWVVRQLPILCGAAVTAIFNRPPLAGVHTMVAATAAAGEEGRPLPAVVWAESTLVLLPLQGGRHTLSVDHGCRGRLAEVWDLLGQGVDLGQSGLHDGDGGGDGGQSGSGGRVGDHCCEGRADVGAR